VYTVDSANRFVQFGFDSQVIEKGRQKTMTIDMSPFFDEEPDAGPSTDAGLDAGSFDAGLPDGGVLRCACDGGCCSPGTTTCLAPNRFTFDAQQRLRQRQLFLRHPDAMPARAALRHQRQRPERVRV